ncbi:hypothetical protein WG66_001252 [Moniliophthora roreri]|nr:hypothetical protein WG66_001252 [Moniliophthora roreri]
MLTLQDKILVHNVVHPRYVQRWPNCRTRIRSI